MEHEEYLVDDEYGVLMNDWYVYHEEGCDEQHEPEFDDDLDGDFDSGMASAGFGTDEDYGCFGDDF
jgi:hypothetical protein